MDSAITGAVFTAVTTLFAVLFRRSRAQARRSRQSEVRQNSPALGYVTIRELERDLRADKRIQKLLGNPKRQAAAEAAIAALLYERECPVESWRHASTWAQVETVLDELMGEVRKTSYSA